MMILDKIGNLTVADQESEGIVMQQETRENATREELTNCIQELRTLSAQLKTENEYLKDFIRKHIVQGEELLRNIESTKTESLDVHDMIAYTELKNIEPDNLELENHETPGQITNYARKNKEEVQYGLRP